MNETLLDYRVPTFEDLPEEMHCIIVENGDGPGPVRGQGLRRGLARGRDGGDRHRARRRRRPDDRAAADAGARLAANPGTEGGRDMAEVRRAAVIGTGTMGPGMGAVLARAGIETALYDVSAEALERAKAGASDGRGRSRSPRGAGDGRRVGPLRDRSRRGARGRGLRGRGGAGEARAEARGVPAVRAARCRGRDPRLEHLRHPDHEDRRGLRAPGARRRHALVEPAAPDPDDRGDPGRADRAASRSTRPASWCADSATTRWSRTRCRASSRTASSTRSCASASTSSTAASSTRRASISTSAGASATSWP